MEKMEEMKRTMEEIRSLKPEGFVGHDVQWMLAVRSALKGRPTLISGFRGTGKTLLVDSVANALQRPLFKFDFGATQDARASLIGNVHFDEETGKYLSDSEFIRAIQPEGAVIMLDNYIRGTVDAHNILMTVLDKQRYLRIDESASSDKVIRLADGVTFFLIWSCKREYTATSVIDKATSDKLLIVEMNPLEKQEITTFLKLYKGLSGKEIDAISSIYSEILETHKKDLINHPISVREIKEIAEMIEDGFPLKEVIECGIFPHFSGEGGLDSERARVKGIINKVISNT